jgi:hypothetical protein
VAFEGFNDGGSKCYDVNFYLEKFRPKWYADAGLPMPAEAP